MIAAQNWPIVAEADDGKEALRKALETKSDVAVIDYSLPLDSFLSCPARERSSLTYRERGMVQLVPEGYTNEQIVGLLDIGLKTRREMCCTTLQENRHACGDGTSTNR